MSGEQYRRRESLKLPPRELWLIDPEKDGKIPTPLNEFGLVDPDKFIEIVKAAVDPSFSWKDDKEPDIHHLYWEHYNYPDLPDDPVNPFEFCQLTTNKIELPYVFHRFAHDITLPPPVPEREVMRRRIDAQMAIVALFDISSQSVRLTRQRFIREGKIERGRAKHLELFSQRLEMALQIPKEFQIIDLSDYRVATTDDIHAISPRLGELVVGRTTVRVRDALRPIAA